MDGPFPCTDYICAKCTLSVEQNREERSFRHPRCHPKKWGKGGGRGRLTFECDLTPTCLTWAESCLLLNSEIKPTAVVVLDTPVPVRSLKLSNIEPG